MTPVFVHCRLGMIKSSPVLPSPFMHFSIFLANVRLMTARQTIKGDEKEYRSDPPEGQVNHERMIATYIFRCVASLQVTIFLTHSLTVSLTHVTLRMSRHHDQKTLTSLYSPLSFWHSSFTIPLTTLHHS